MTRHQRRKAARQASLERSERIVLAHRAWERSETVKRNLSVAKERNYYPQSQMAGLSENAARFNCSGRGPGAMNRRRALALKAQGKW